MDKFWYIGIFISLIVFASSLYGITYISKSETLINHKFIINTNWTDVAGCIHNINSSQMKDMYVNNGSNAGNGVLGLCLNETKAGAPSWEPIMGVVSFLCACLSFMVIGLLLIDFLKEYNII
jgi:hypothetical protein